ncbi:hypothetical protein JCM10212_005831 [Sporobolomyces blumeae]
MTIEFDSLLLESTTHTVTIDRVYDLSPNQLAISSLRPDLAVPLRQRAFAHFLAQRTAYVNGQRTRPLALFDVRLDFDCPASIDELSPYQLVLLKFNPNCTSPTRLDEASSNFLDLARRSHRPPGDAPCRVRSSSNVDTGFPLARIRVTRYRLGIAPEVGDGAIVCDVHRSGLDVSHEGDLVLEIASDDLASLCYVVDPYDDDSGKFDCIVEIRLRDRAPPPPRRSDLVKLDLGVQSRDSSSFSTLAAQVTKWQAEKGFQLGMRRPQSSTVQSSASNSSRALCAAKRPRPASPSPLASTLARRRPQAPPTAPVTIAEMWRFVGTEPAEIAWHPGYYLRQDALLWALDSTLPRLLPHFTSEELELLSYRPDLSKLPSPTAHNLPEAHPELNHDQRERLALEKIYEGTPGGIRMSKVFSPSRPGVSTRLERCFHLSFTRSVLLTSTFTVLRAYAQQYAKLVACRDVFKSRLAYKRLLVEYGIERTTRNGDDGPETNERGPIGQVRELLTRLRDDEGYRKHAFLEPTSTSSSTASASSGQRFRLCTMGPFTTNEIGHGPAERLGRAVALIVRREEQGRESVPSESERRRGARPGSDPTRSNVGQGPQGGEKTTRVKVEDASNERERPLRRPVERSIPRRRVVVDDEDGVDRTDEGEGRMVDETFEDDTTDPMSGVERAQEANVNGTEDLEDGELVLDYDVTRTDLVI